MKPYYEHAGVRLFHADCRDVLPSLPGGRNGGPKLLLTDPPYGVGMSTTNHRQRALAMATIANDQPADRSVIEMCLDEAWSRLDFYGHAYVFGPFDLARLPHAAGVCELVWDKQFPTMGDIEHPWGKQHEFIQFAIRMDGAVNGKRGGAAARRRGGSVLRHPRPNGSGAKHHISEKPVSLLRELIEMSSRHGDLVLDPFAGSGSTLVAAVIEGRRAVGIELEEPWCEVAAKRLDDLTRQVGLFGGVGI